MCLAKIFYIGKNDNIELVLLNTSTVDVSGEKITLTSILGDKNELRGFIGRIDFENSVVVIKDKDHAHSA